MKNLASLDKYAVMGPDGKVIRMLNERLVTSQNLTDEQLEALKMSHQVRYMLFKAAETVLDQPLKLRMLAAVFDSLETEQQKLWGFKPDLTFHCFYNFPGCQCPVLDNQDRLGVAGKVHVSKCPIHGWD